MIHQVQKYGHKLQALAQKKSSYFAKILNDTNSSSFDGRVAAALRSWWATFSNETDSLPPTQITKASKRPMLKLSDIKETNVFFDVCGQIVHMYSEESSQVTVVLTDYTTNDNLAGSIKSVDTYTYPVTESMLLNCTLWDENATKARSLIVGSYIVLRNVRSKFDRNGQIEGIIHGDRDYPEKSCFSMLDGGAIELRELKKREAERRAEFGPRTTITDSGTRGSTISEMLQHPTAPYKFHLRAKVCDHMPKEVKHFTRPWCEMCNHSLTPETETCPTCNNTITSYQYMFSLLLTDGSGHVPIILSGPEARTFLQNLPPTDLTRDPNRLQQVRAYLGRLFDLDASKSMETLQSAKWFDCLVESYVVGGREGEGGVRRYKMYGTVITGGGEFLV
ncbi:hypothetical protein HDV00_003048 [Rhizophlyctis rosea]|nr:hypothetical protein HDV00_003048 [Rhizophlyctis rosea]